MLCIIFHKKCFSCYILLTDQISLSHCLYFSKYWAICVLRLFFNQLVKSWDLKLALSFLSSRFATWPKSQYKNVNILRKKGAFVVKQKAFFIIFKGLSVAKNCIRPERGPFLIILVFFNHFGNLYQKTEKVPH